MASLMKESRTLVDVDMSPEVETSNFNNLELISVKSLASSSTLLPFLVSRTSIRLLRILRFRLISLRIMIISSCFAFKFFIFSSTRMLSIK